MNCNEFSELLFSYMEDELDNVQKKNFEDHMKSCPYCDKEYRAYQKMMSDIHALPMEELPKGYCKRLHGKLEDAKLSKVKKKRNNYLKYIGIAASCVLVISAIYFTGSNFNGYSKSNSAKDLDSKTQENYNMAMSEDKSSAMPQETEKYDMAMDDATDSGSMTTTEFKKSSFSSQVMESKIIKSGRLEIQTLDFDSFIDNLNQVVANNSGYIEYNETIVRYKTEDKEYKDASIKLRIPQESFYDVVDYIDNQSDAYNKYVNETDVTKEYYDKQNILTNLEIQENRLRELYNKAENITDILALENEITRIRTEIDTYSIDLSDIDDRVSMATIELDVSEVEGKNINIPNSKGLWSKSKEGFVRTINNIIDGVESIIVWIISYLPIIILIAIGYIIFRVVKKKIKN